MGCGPGVAGKSRSAGVFVASITFSTRTPGSITRASVAPRIRAAAAAAITQRLVRAFTHFFGECRPLVGCSGCREQVAHEKHASELDEFSHALNCAADWKC